MNLYSIENSEPPSRRFKARTCKLTPGASCALRRLSNAGYLLVCCTNQPAAAKGVTSIDALNAVHARVLQLLEAEGARIDNSQICFHHPQGIVATLTKHCDCRQPAPGMLLVAAAALDIDLASSWMIGDADTDIEAGQSAGCGGTNPDRSPPEPSPATRHCAADGLCEQSHRGRADRPRIRTRLPFEHVMLDQIRTRSC